MAYAFNGSFAFSNKSRTVCWLFIRLSIAVAIFSISNCIHFCNQFLISSGINERINNTRETTIIDGPEEVFNSNELNNPITTEVIPAKTDIIIICLGLLLRLSRSSRY